jgi:hypothetical protein
VYLVAKLDENIFQKEEFTDIYLEKDLDRETCTWVSATIQGLRTFVNHTHIAKAVGMVWVTIIMSVYYP